MSTAAASARRHVGAAHAEGGDRWPGWGPGYATTDVSRVVGRGGRAFARARAGLLGWDVQRLAGVHVDVATPPVADGVEVTQTAGPGGLLVARCRVRDVVDEPGRAGFTYETLRPHPEEGWESFALVLDGEDVAFRVRSWSRLVWAPARLASPAARAAQRLAVTRYLRAARQLAR